MATEEDGATIEAGQPPGEHQSQWEMFWQEFRRNNLSLIGGIVILLLVFVAIFAPVFAPHDPIRQFGALEGMHHPVPPGTTILKVNTQGEVLGQTTALLGTDHLGRDLLSRLIFGIRTLLIISISVVAVSMLIGVAVGGIAGYYSDTWTDESIMRFMDILFAFPSLVLAIAVLGVLGIGTTTIAGIAIPQTFKIILVVGITYIPAFARVMRSTVLKEMEEDYIDAAKSLGAGDAHIFGRDVVTNTIPTVVVQATLYMGTAVLAAAALSFLGLGIQPPKASLGLMLSVARGYLYSGAWWFSVLPGLVIVLTILSFNLLGDGLRDALDPRYSTEERR